jgi:hypothetical protein
MTKYLKVNEDSGIYTCCPYCDKSFKVKEKYPMAIIEHSKNVDELDVAVFGNMAINRMQL